MLHIKDISFLCSSPVKTLDAGHAFGLVFFSGVCGGVSPLHHACVHGDQALVDIIIISLVACIVLGLSPSTDPLASENLSLSLCRLHTKDISVHLSVFFT